VKAICPICGVVSLTVGQQIGATVTCGLIGAAFGSQATKNAGVTLGCALAGLLLGSYIDHVIEKRCPRCGAVLRIAGPLLA
jgi:hypothetical protein